MKTLLLLRHGKSDWDTAYNGDHQRPLAPRGVRSARMMGRLITAMDLVPDRLLTSTAVRSASTATLASEAGQWGLRTELEDRFYGSGVDEVLGAASRSGGERLMLVGHEPTWSMLVRRLTGASVQMKTASLAVVDLMIDEWTELPHCRGVLSLLVHPRHFFGSEWDPES